MLVGLAKLRVAVPRTEEDLSEYSAALATIHARTKIATDGGSTSHKKWHRAGGWGLAFKVNGRVLQVGGRLTGIDQISYMAGPIALHRALAIVDEAPTAAHIIIDNWAVCAGAKNLQQGGKPNYIRVHIWCEIQQMILRCDVEFDWVPSHGKKDEWTPHNGEDPAEWRELNGLADEIASKYPKEFLADTMTPLRVASGRYAAWSADMLKKQGEALNQLVGSRFPVSPQEAQGGVSWLRAKKMQARIDALGPCSGEDYAAECGQPADETTSPASPSDGHHPPRTPPLAAHHP